MLLHIFQGNKEGYLFFFKRGLGQTIYKYKYIYIYCAFCGLNAKRLLIVRVDIKYTHYSCYEIDK